MKMKAALRQKESWEYWLFTTDASDVAIRRGFMKRANKPSGNRKAIAALSASYPRAKLFRKAMSAVTKVSAIGKDNGSINTMVQLRSGSADDAAEFAKALNQAKLLRHQPLKPFTATQD